jgi:hypothetical protein
MILRMPMLLHVLPQSKGAAFFLARAFDFWWVEIQPQAIGCPKQDNMNSKYPF